MIITGGMTFSGGFNLTGQAVYLYQPETYSSSTVLLLQADKSYFSDDISVFNNVLTSTAATATSFVPSSFTTISAQDGSGYFGGSAYLTAPATVGFGFGTGDFTVEAWIYKTATGNLGIWSNGPASAGSFSFYIIANKLQVDFYGGTSTTGATTLVSNTWYHIAVSRSGTALRIFLNGTIDASATSSSNNTTSNCSVGLDWTGGTTYFSGYISNLRVIHGRALYTNTFTVSTQALTLSPTPLNASNYSFDLAASSYVSTPSDATLAYGTADFTIECWFRLTNATSSYRVIWGQNSGSILRFGNTGFGDKLQFAVDQSTVATVWSCAVTASSVLNTWTHVAWTRTNGANRLYVNGVLQSIGSGSNPVTYPSTSFTNASSFASPQNGAIGNLFVGQISNFRITNGYAVYSGNFTPPTNRLTTTQSTGTSNILPITSLVQPYSVLFNGSSQYLTTASALIPASGDFTVECWIYPTSFAAINEIFCQRDTGGSIGRIDVSIAATTGIPTLFIGSSPTTTSIISTVAFIVNTWSHVAVTRSGNNFVLYLNGVSVGTGSVATDILQTGFMIGALNSSPISRYFSGYISNLRIVTGAAVYIGAFTTPTSRLTTTQSAGTNIAAITSSIVNYSVLFNGSSQYLSVANNTALNLNAAFTVEGWFYFTALSVSADNVFYNKLIVTPSLTGVELGVKASGAKLYAWLNGADRIVGSTTIVVNTWYHFAITRDSSNNLGLFVNGVSDATAATYAGDTTTTASAYIAAQYNASSRVTGYISNFRMVKGVAVYTGNFTVPTTALPVVAGTSLLTLQSATFVDNSVNAYTITPTGSPVINTFNPFGGTTVLLTAQDPIIQDNSSLASSITNVGATTTSTQNPFGSTALLTAQDTVIQDNSVNAVTLTTTGGPGVSPLTPFGVTALLTLQSNAGDNNNTVENFARTQTTSTLISKVGTVTPGPFGPFNPSGWSNYFNTGDKLTFPSSSAFDLSGSTWTIEFWMYSLATPTSGNQCRLLMAGANGDAAGWNISYDNTGYLGFFRPYSGSPVGITTPTSTIALNTWYHVAFVCNAGSARIYINGVSVAGPVTISLPTSASQTLRIGYDDPGTVNFQYNGYISNLRIVKDRAIYTGNFTPSTRSLTTAVTPSIDYSVSFNGTTQYLTTNYSINWSTLGSYTLEFWIYLPSLTTNQTFFTTGNAAAGTTGFYVYGAGAQLGAVGLGIFGTNEITTTNNAITTNQWYHIAYNYNGTTTTIYVNGVARGSGTTAIYANNSGNFVIAAGNTTPSMTGYISNLRLVTGQAVYTGNFTVPTGTLARVAGTRLLTLQSATLVDNSVNAYTITPTGSPVIGTFSPFGTTVLLTCQSNRFVDNSTNALAPTVTGAPVIALFSPLPPTDSYNASVHGSSLYFSGSSSYLNFTQEPNLYQFAGDFTIEAWVYSLSATGQASYSGIFDTRATNVSSTTGIVVNLTPTGYLNFYINSNNYTSATLLGANNWTHVALVRSGSTISMYQNGVSVASVSYATSLSSGNFWVGTLAAAGATGFWQGYISDLRAVNGAAVYTSAFTPPTLPLSATAQTVVLLNGNSAGIIDSTGKNILTTVGGAKLNHAIVKYGAGSIFFDGTTGYLTIPYGNFAFEFGSGNYTIELWLYALATTGSSTVFARGNPGSLGTDYFTLEFQGNQLQHYVGAYTTAAPVCAAVGITWANTWHHVAVVRNVNTWTMYVDGVAQATTITGAYTITATTSPNPSYIATSTYSTSRYFSGYMDDIRISRIARYTANFTAPTTLLSTGTYIQIG